ncbi:hypothetical protein [Hymenobacter rubidus]|uniref:hypothetical protein n=1 Tax=Hymenobacter rubidus TaxID=1441626 RepID=UPI00191FA452|nr:hypothetical protein [Hymenobacter rubidus]
MLRPVFSRLLPLVLLLAVACHQQKPAIVTTSPTSMKQLEGTWLSSLEDNQGDTLAYRLNTHTFKSAQHRTGFAIRPYGRFEQFDIAPAGGLTGRPGTWTPDGPTGLRIHLQDGQTPDYTLEVLALQKQVLKLRRH